MRIVNKTGREIDYNTLLDNVEQMIGLLEYDSMRSAGKCKLNGVDLNNLYSLKDRYEAMLKGAKTQDAKATRKKVEAVAND